MQHSISIELPKADVSLKIAKDAGMVNIEPDTQVLAFMVVINASEAAQVQKPNSHEVGIE